VTTFTDDFTNPTTSAANWATTFQGYAGGSQAYVSNTDVLTTVPSQINSVAQRNTGPYTDAKVTVSITGGAGANANYFDLSLGTGAIYPQGGGSTNWWHTVLASGYTLQLNGATLYLLRISSSGVSTQIGVYSIAGGFVAGTTHTFELSISAGVVSGIYDGATVITASDSTYTAGGDILIAQGRYTTNQGGNATISLVNATGPGSSGITGTLTATQAANTLASGAAVAIHGTLSKTQASGSVSASGTLHVTGSLARTQGANALAASGHVAVRASLAVTQAGNTLVATGSATSGIVGSLSATQAPQALASSGHLKATGALHATQAAQTVVAQGAAAIHGALSATQAAQSLVARGSTENAIAGELDVTQASQTVSAGGHGAIHGSASVTQNNNALAALGAAVIRGALNAHQASNTLQASGSAPRQPITGQLAVTQAAQTLQAFGETTAFFIASGRLVLLSPENRTVLLNPEPRTILLEA
jgi:hypothetical protein